MKEDKSFSGGGSCAWSDEEKVPSRKQKSSTLPIANGWVVRWYTLGFFFDGLNPRKSARVLNVRSAWLAELTWRIAPN